MVPPFDLADPQQLQAYLAGLANALRAGQQVMTCQPDGVPRALPCCFVFVALHPSDGKDEPAAIAGGQGVDLDQMAAYLARYHHDLALELSTALAIELYAPDHPPVKPRSAALTA